jgi:hypothetical protein
VTNFSARGVPTSTGQSSRANSAILCRQPPQGVVGTLESATTATARTALPPAATSAAIAAASAHNPCG